jgi:hypothetical protein
MEYVVLTDCEAVSARVLLNGCTVFATRDPLARSMRVSLLPWLVETDNHLEIELALAADNDGDEPGGARFSCALHGLPRGATPHGSSLLIAYRYMPETFALRDPPIGVFHHAFRPQQHCGRWLWQDAKPYADSDREGIERLLATAHEALGNQDPVMLGALLNVKLMELSRALDMPLDDMEREQMRYFEQHFEDDFELEPLGELEIDPDPNGKLVHVYGPDRQAPLRGRGGGRPFALPIVVSHVDDAWLIVR